jgi:hypothetical protein
MLLLVAGIIILFTSLIPTRKNKRFDLEKRVIDPVGVFVFGVPLVSIAHVASFIYYSWPSRSGMTDGGICNRAC